ncbi:hypothetical protein LTR85_001297 [Meristemomyces frigidus]|nr:hypothetical protein LTR85_001297 [Meristemomyces frigidus]
MFALVAAVWLQAGDWSHTLTAMANLGLLCRRDSFVSPRELVTIGSPTNLFGVVVPYRARIAEEIAEQETQYSNAGADHITWNETIQLDERPASPMELERAISSVTTTPMLAPPSSIGNHRSNSQADFSNDTFDVVSQSSLVSADEYFEAGFWERQPNTHSISRTDGAAQAGAPEHEHISTGNDEHAPFDSYSPTAIREIGDTGLTVSHDALGGIDGLGSEYVAAISALPTEHHNTLVQLIRYIGSSSAVLSLRLIVGNVRDVHLNGVGKKNAMRIAATRSSAERLAAIDDLSACMAHFTLAQRMHIYMLYKEALVEGSQNGVPANGRDPFVFESGVSSVRSRGNPNHLQTAAIARNMTAPGQSPARAKRLRRVGRRLDVLVENFGRGVLALLDEKCTHEMILKVTDQVFVDFVAVTDRFEGDRIRLISERACPIVDMLFDDGDSNRATRYRIENIQEDLTINQEPRCSLNLAMMLLPQIETDGNGSAQEGGEPLEYVSE